MGAFDFIKNIFKSDGGKLSWIQVLIMGLVPLGQLWARIFYFKGSLDKWWLMFPLLLLPPLSFIPLIMMKFGFISNGKGTNPIDKIMLLPIIAKFIIPFILPFIVDEDEHVFLFSLVGFVLQLLTIMIANLTRRYNNCNDITVDSIGKASMDSVIAYGVADIVSFGIGFVPFIGIFISLLGMIPIVGNFVDQIIWTLGFTGTYVIINMFNQDDIRKYCTTPFTGNTQDKIPFIISIIAIILVNFINQLNIF
jgi:hypothetical protein